MSKDKSKESSDKGLPSEQIRRRFAIEYVRDFDAIHAMARTYDVLPSDIQNDPSLSEQALALPHDPSTNEYIEQQLSYLQDRYEVDREFLVLKTRQILDQCMRAVPVMEKVRGQLVESGEFEFDSLGAIKAVQTLYEITGLKYQKIEDGDDDKTGVMMVPQQASPEEWGTMIAQTRDLQSDSLTRILEDFDPGDDTKAN